MIQLQSGRQSPVLPQIGGLQLSQVLVVKTLGTEGPAQPLLIPLRKPGEQVGESLSEGPSREVSDFLSGIQHTGTRLPWIPRRLRVLVSTD